MPIKFVEGTSQANISRDSGGCQLVRLTLVRSTPSKISTWTAQEASRTILSATTTTTLEDPASCVAEAEEKLH